MMSESEITAKLKEIGFKNSEIPKILRDIGLLIGGKALAAYIDMLPEDERARMLALQPEEIDAYVKEKEGLLPKFSQEQFDAIHDQAWQEYFAAMTKN